MRPSFLQRIAAGISRPIGRENPLIRLLRPAYEGLLDLSSGGKGFLVTVNGSERFYVNPRSRAHFGEVYEPEVCAYLRAHVKPGAVILNVGAHVGIYALSFASWSGRSGRIFAFEPNPSTREILADQIARNGLRTQIEIVPCAVSATPGEAMFSATVQAGFSRLGQANPWRPEQHAALTVPVTNIDTFCDERHVVPDWITLDIEGYEVAALAGARRTIELRRGRLGLIVEMHPGLWAIAGTSRSELEGLLRDLRLVPDALTGQRDPLDESGVVRLDYA